MYLLLLTNYDIQKKTTNQRSHRCLRQNLLCCVHIAFLAGIVPYFRASDKKNCATWSVFMCADVTNSRRQRVEIFILARKTRFRNFHSNWLPKLHHSYRPVRGCIYSRICTDFVCHLFEQTVFGVNAG